MGRIRGAKGRTAPEPPSPAAEAGVSSSAPQVNNLVEPETWEAGGDNRDAHAVGPPGREREVGGGVGRRGNTISARGGRCAAS